jgi:hypothetical protein
MGARPRKAAALLLCNNTPRRSAIARELPHDNHAA